VGKIQRLKNKEEDDFQKVSDASTSRRKRIASLTKGEILNN
jgi:hypothetical protein